MTIDDSNVTTNSRWNPAHDIRQTISQMDDYQKEQCLIKIQARTTLLEQPHDPKILKYVTTLLKGKEPKKGISK